MVIGTRRGTITRQEIHSKMKGDCCTQWIYSLIMLRSNTGVLLLMSMSLFCTQQDLMLLEKGKWVEVPEGREGASEAEVKGTRVIRSWESTQTWTGKTTKGLNLSQNAAHYIQYVSLSL